MSLAMLGQALQEKGNRMRLDSVRNKGVVAIVKATCIALSCIAFLSPWANAAVFWEDELEPGNTGYPLVGGMSYATSPVYSGTHSLKEHFIGNHNQSGTYIERYFGTSTEDLWSRYYIYLDNFIPDAQVGTKMMLQGEACCYPSFWWIMPFGQTTLTVAVQGINGGTETLNISGANIPQNRWACIETHIRMSGPGARNGIIEAWIDGNQVIARYDLPMRDATANGKNSPTAKFTFNQLYVQYGQGDLYYDKLAVGNQRIGCSGAPPQSEAPSQPTPPAPAVPEPTPPPQTKPEPTPQPSLMPPPTPSGLFIR